MTAPAETSPETPRDEPPATPTVPGALNGLTPRALIAGFFLSLLLCGVNSYLTLSFGVIEEGPTIAALFFFAFFFLSSTKINSAEMVIVATMGSAGGSLGFITNFYAAEAMAATPLTFWQMAGFSVVTSLVGLVFVIPLRQLLILKDKLPWPGSKAVESVIRALVEKGDPKQPYILLATCVVMIAIVVLNDEDGYGFIPSGTALPLLAAYGGAIAWSPFAIGGAYLMGFRTCVGFLVGAVALMIMAPYLPEPSAPQRYVWPGIGFLVAAGLTQMALQGKTIVQSMKSLFSRTSADDDDPIMSSATFGVFTGIALIVAAAFAWFGLGLSFVVTVLLIVVGGFLQNVIATRAAAQTAFNPARVMGILLQGVTALAGGTSAAQNLAGAGFVAGSGAQAGVLTGDLAYGRWLKVPSRWQFWTQLVTVVPCSLVSAWVFEQILAQQGGHMSIEGPGLSAPVAKMWAATSLIFSGEADLPPFAYQAMAIGGAIGCVYVLIEQNEKIEKWLPSSTGIGLGLVLAPALGLSFFLGGLLFVVADKQLKIREVSLTTFAVGCIVAEGIGGVLKPLLALAHLIPPGAE